MVAEVILLVAGQQVARVDAKGIVALVADRLLLTKWHDRRDPIGKAVGRERLLLELDVGAGVVAKPAAASAIRTGPLEHQDRKSTRLNSSHITRSRMPSSA